MKKQQNPYLVPIITSLIVGVFLGYSLSYFAPNLGAALVSGKKVPTTRTVSPASSSNSATIAANVDQCKQNCEKIGESKCTPTDPNQKFSTSTHAFCVPHTTRTGTYYTCGHTACGGSKLGEIYAFPPVGYVPDPAGSGNYYQNCATVQCNVAVQRGYWSESFRR